MEQQLEESKSKLESAEAEVARVRETLSEEGDAVQKELAAAREEANEAKQQKLQFLYFIVQNMNLDEYKAKAKVVVDQLKARVKQVERERDEYRDEASGHLSAIEGYKEMIKLHADELVDRDAKTTAKVKAMEEDYETKVEFYKGYVAKMDVMIQEGNGAINKLKAEHNISTDDELKRYQQAASLFEMEKREHNMTIENLTRQINRLKQEVGGNTEATPPDALAQENQKLKDEILQWERHIMEQQALYRELDLKEKHTSESYEKLVLENKEKDRTLSEWKQKAKARMEAELAKYQAELQSKDKKMKFIHGQAKEQCTKERSKSEALEKRLQEMMNGGDAAMKSLTELNAELTTTNKEAEKSIEDLNLKLHDLETKLSTSAANLTTLQSERDTLSQQLSELQSDQSTELAKVTKERDDLSARLSSTESNEAEKQQLLEAQTKINELTNENKELQTKLESQNTAASEQNTAELEEKLQAALSAKSDLEAKAAALRDKAKQKLQQQNWNHRLLSRQRS
eukprot:TRINITY_DN78_c0_g1_i14.p1 TRINITY_DN78_c0_g1~~TRINITY_DN78_c0_g1_i14.p1  ORF type:complete len:534 (+),score=182.92 TRINITY_DN78_c0_g1_i14:58-1602(+)